MTVAADAVPPRTVVLDRYAAAGSLPALAVIPCPVCVAGRERATDYVRSRSKLPPDADTYRLDSATLDTYSHQQPAIAAVVQLLERCAGWLTLVGGYGTGKSTLLLAALNHLHDLGLVGGYWTAAELVRHLRFDPMQPDAGVIRLQRLQHAPVLAIDELDKYRSTPFAEENIFELLNYRHQQRATLITVLGTNDETVIPGGLRSRLRDSRCTVVQMGETDVRLLRADEQPANVWDRGEGEG